MSPRALLLSLAAVLWIGGDAAAQRRPKLPKPGAAAELTFVGNSYTFFNDLPAFVRALGTHDAPARKVGTTMLTDGGYTLQMHWSKAGAKSPAKVIRKQKPDFVVFQEQSRRPYREPKLMDDFAEKFTKVCKKAKATPVWFMTWARRNEPKKQDAIRAQYEKVHKDNGGLLAPVGVAWQLVREEHEDLVLHLPDNSHPNPKGTYLAACVIYGTVFGGDVTRFPDKLQGRDPAGAAKVLIELPAAEGKILRAAAARALATKPEKKRTRRR